MVPRRCLTLRPRPSTRPPPIHALLIDHVISRVSDSRFLKRKDLLHMRQVCRAWNAAVTPTVGKKFYLDIGGEHGEDRDLEISNLMKILDLVENPNGNFPIPDTLLYDSAYFSDDPRLLILLMHISRKVRRLEDQNGGLSFEVPEDEDLRFPNLKKYGLVIPAELPASFSKNPERLLGHMILRNSPILEEVTVCWDVAANNKDPKVLAIETDLLRSFPKTLRKLTIAKSFTHSGAQVFSSLTWYRLSYLVLDFRSLSVVLDSQEFCSLFNNCKDMLTDLEVIHYKYAVQFPVFPRLTHLTLLIKDAPDSRAAPLHRLQAFATHFPAVQVLDIMLLSSESVTGALFPVGTFAPQVKTIRYPFVFRNYILYFNLSETFFGLKTLILTPVSMREELVLLIIFKQLTKLEILRINFEKTPENYKNTWLDVGLTGICENCCTYITKNGQLDYVEKKVVKSNPGLTDLTNLRVLHLRGVNPEKLRITDITGYLAILQMPSLKQLHMDNFQLSKRCLRDLRAKFGSLRHAQSFDDFSAQMDALPRVQYLN